MLEADVRLIRSAAMKPWVWAWNAALRTLRGMRPDWADPDDAWARSRLPEVEFELYRSMDPRDRDHAVRVAKALLRRHADAQDEVVRAALLHDVGKSQLPYRVHERIFVHVLRAGTPPPSPLRAGFAGARQLAAHHPRIGAEMIRKAGGSDRVAELVRRHERPGDDEQAAWIREADRRT